MKPSTAATANNFSLKIAMLLSLAFSISANAQLIECRPTKYSANFITLQAKGMRDCKKQECETLKIDVDKCEKSSSFYKCTKDESDDAYAEKISITINRIDGTAVQFKTLLKKSNNSYSEHTHEYESCEVNKATPKF